MAMDTHSKQSLLGKRSPPTFNVNRSLLTSAVCFLITAGSLVASVIFVAFAERSNADSRLINTFRTIAPEQLLSIKGYLHTAERSASLTANAIELIPDATFNRSVAYELLYNSARKSNTPHHL